jgi:hypothetical protein
LYVYALVDRAPAQLGRGLDDERLAAVRVDGFQVVVGRMAAGPPVAERSLRAHDAVVRQIAAAARAVLPVRFGSQVADRRALVRQLLPRADELGAALEQVAGCAQMTVRLFRAARLRLRRSSSGGPGARYLAARAAAREPPELAPLRRAVGRLVRAERIEPHARAPLVASVYHLVRQIDAPEYAAAVERVRARLAASGPWPPYAFAPEVLG